MLYRLVLALVLAGCERDVGFGQAVQPSTGCTPARAMFLVDRSTSTLLQYLDGEKQWDVVAGEVGEFALSNQQGMELGLAVFPESEWTCRTGGRVVVDAVARGAGTAIETGLAAWPPSSHAFGPVGQALDELAARASDDATHRRAVVLLSDGRQGCPSSEPDEEWSTARIVDQVEALRAMGVLLYVIGVGGEDEVDSYGLNQMAVAGGTSVGGCGSAIPCYLPARSRAELRQALATVAGELGACEPECVDGEHRACGSDIGECVAGSQTCAGGSWGECRGAIGPVDESCDGADNDCDGVRDNGCECSDGDRRACGSDVGECRAGTQTCAGGSWTGCQGEVGPAAESCDGADNDCDGVADEGCECLDGERRACGPDVGECVAGAETCAGGTWGECRGAVGPTGESCDGRDNDCDGTIDGAAADRGCRVEQLCVAGTCQDREPAVAAPAADATAAASEGGCSAAGGARRASGAGVVLLALVLAARRRRAALVALAASACGYQPVPLPPSHARAAVVADDSGRAWAEVRLEEPTCGEVWVEHDGVQVLMQLDAGACVFRAALRDVGAAPVRIVSSRLGAVGTVEIPPPLELSGPAADAVLSPDDDALLGWRAGDDAVRWRTAVSCDAGEIVEGTLESPAGASQLAVSAARLAPPGADCDVLIEARRLRRGAMGPAVAGALEAARIGRVRFWVRPPGASRR